MNEFSTIVFGPTGVVGNGPRLRVQDGPASLRHLTAATQTGPGLAGEEQLR